MAKPREKIRPIETVQADLERATKALRNAQLHVEEARAAAQSPPAGADPAQLTKTLDDARAKVAARQARVSELNDEQRKLELIARAPADLASQLRAEQARIEALQKQQQDLRLQLARGDATARAKLVGVAAEISDVEFTIGELTGAQAVAGTARSQQQEVDEFVRIAKMRAEIAKRLLPERVAHVEQVEHAAWSFGLPLESIRALNDEIVGYCRTIVAACVHNPKQAQRRKDDIDGPARGAYGGLDHALASALAATGLGRVGIHAPYVAIRAPGVYGSLPTMSQAIERNDVALLQMLDELIARRAAELGIEVPA